ncbi:Gfo/Idh/MocA family protein [Sciscionella marina]|uniref:Gfo/Idh/MocA family protein n=1 Tax=Sciscionella marina TaxID=508770 RepID=UPI000378BA56|nr:Gfo/Idh/MocA family oxidoreductase [Sciscionella marina]
MDNPVRLGILGLDHWYAAIPLAERAAADPAVDLRVIADPDPERATHVSRLTGGVRTSTDFEAVLADDGIEAIACFPSLERSPALTIAAARAGKHIIGVKPLARTLAEADAVVEAVEQAGICYVPSEARRDSPLSRRLAELVRSGRIGELRSGAFSMHSGLPKSWPGSEAPGWFADPACVPGGGWIDHSVYHLDRLRHLFDSPIASITGTVTNLAYPELPVEDYGHATVVLGNGAVVGVEDTWIAPPGCSSNRVQLVGSAGAIYYDSMSLGVADAGGEWSFTALPPDPFGNLDALLAVLRHGAQPSATVHTARATLAACLDFYATARKTS